MAFYLAAKNVANRLFQKLHDFCFNRFLCWIFIYDIFLSKRQFMLQLLFVLLDNVTEQPANSHCPLQSDAVCNRLWLWRCNGDADDAYDDGNNVDDGDDDDYDNNDDVFVM